MSKETKIRIKGFVPVGVVRDVDFYFSRTQKKFVDSVDKLFLGDLFYSTSEIDLGQIKEDYPLVDSMRGVAKIKISIEL